eukprot:SAG11_NODE_14445_length_611_cov_2.115234_1_plen_77_part_01
MDSSAKQFGLVRPVRVTVSIRMYRGGNSEHAVRSVTGNCDEVLVKCWLTWTEHDLHAFSPLLCATRRAVLLGNLDIP